MEATKINRKPLVKSGTRFEWKIDCYDGCEHGCRYCYAWWIKRGTRANYSSWINPSPISNVTSDLKLQLSRMQDSTKAKIKDIFVSSLTDCYQPLELQYGITREVIETLIEHELPFTVLTKNVNVLRDKDLFKNYDKCRVGLTIITLDETLRQSLEPNSSLIAKRVEALKELKEEGISTYCSVEPILPDKRSNPVDIVEVLNGYVDLFEFGMWNPKYNSQRLVEKTLGTIYKEDYYVDVFKSIKEYCDKNKTNYCHAGHSEDFLNKNQMNFIPYPTVLK